MTGPAEVVEWPQPAMLVVEHTGSVDSVKDRAGGEQHNKKRGGRGGFRQRNRGGTRRKREDKLGGSFMRRLVLSEIERGA